MKPLTAVAVSAATAVALMLGVVVLFDRLAPSLGFQTDVHSSTSLQGNVDTVYYIVPLTGGELASCRVGRENLQKFQEGMEIEVSRSLLLDRCLGIKSGGRVMYAR